MKKLFTLLSVIVLFAACKKNSFLDDKTNNALNEASVFSDSVRTISFLTRIYEDVPFAFIKNRWEQGGQEQSTDDSELTLSNPVRRPVVIYSSTYSADYFPFFTEVWQTPFTNIRRVNLLLSKLSTTPLSAATQKRVAGEARFLRAWYYFNLIINFGGMPIIKDQIFGITDVVNPPRSTFEETVNYVVKELDDVATILPASYDGNDYGRVTKGAALGLKSKLLLFAASPLFNGGVFPNPSTPAQVALASYPTYNVARWQAAADAALTVINSGIYSLNLDNATAPGYGFYSLFLKRINTEYIFYYNRSPNRDYEYFYLPQSRGGLRYGTPTQTLVDCFPMKNGKAITDPTSGYDPKFPYRNREPRFNYSIIYNGALWYSQTTGSKTPVNTYVGGDPQDGLTYTSTTNGYTGYFSRKMCDENLAGNSSGNTDRGWSLIRYGEILLSYAEAINETGQTELAYPYLKQLRDRAGIDPGSDGNYGMKPNMTVAEMRTFVQNERHIELMYENERWDDVRRWKIAMVTQNGYNKRINITKSADGTFNYQVLNTNRLNIFYPNDYLLPIPTSEIRKAPALIQNPGWL